MSLQSQVISQLQGTVLQNQSPSSAQNATIPYMRSRPVEFVAENLRPGRVSQFFFGDINVSRFIQQGSVMRPDAANANVAIYGNVNSQERFYCNTTHAFATAIGAANGTIYFNENYTTVNVAPVGANSLSTVVYNVGDVLVQYGPNGFPTNYHPDDIQLSIAPTYYEGQVVYWNQAAGVLVLENQVGTITSNVTSSNAGTWFYKGGVTTIVSANNIVQGAGKWPVGALVSSIDDPANSFLVGTYIHRSGSLAYTANALSNVIAVQAKPDANIIGNVAVITGGVGAGRGGNVLSIGVDSTTGANLVWLDANISPHVSANSTYSLGYNYVDSTGYLMGIYTIPESPTVSFQTGTQIFTITDSPIVDDPFATMVAKGTYVANFDSGGSYSTALTPAYSQSVSQPAVSSQATVPSALISLTNATTVTAAPGPNSTYAGVVSQVSANAAANGTYNGVSIQWPWALFDVDPIAQTFITPPPSSLKTNYGIFLQKIAIWFNSKPVSPAPLFPVQLFIVTTNNGVPTSNVIASCSVPWDMIRTSAVPDSVNVQPDEPAPPNPLGVNNTVTQFIFKDPVYLAPSTEYAIILYSESPDYEVYVSQVGQFDTSSAGAGKKRISAVPNVGSFFRSQNASAWTPYNNEMLMFMMYQSMYTTNPVTFNFTTTPQKADVLYDKILLNSTDINFSLTDLIYKVQTTVANTLALDVGLTQVFPGTVYSFGSDLKTSSLTSQRERVLRASNNQSLQVQVNMGTQDANLSPMFNEQLLSGTLVKNVVNNGGIHSNNISIISTGNHINAANIVVTFSAPDLPDGTQATGNVAALKGNSVVSINMTYSGSGYSLTPTITISEPGAPANATAIVAGENGVSGGNAISRYITKQVTLAQGMDAGDLRVYMKCVRPTGSDICVYYKALSGSDSQSFSNLPWVKMTMVNDINSPDQSTPINLVFAPALGVNGQPTGFLSYVYNGVQYPLGGSFKYFAIKIVLFADDPAVVPSVGSYQAIAYPGG